VARHPRLVYCSISGYGLRGEERNRPTYDIGAFWARSGLSMQMADGEGNPLNARGGIGDHITGLAALAGLLAAVLEQRATGRGRVVEVSLLRTGPTSSGWDLGLQMTLGKVARAEPRERNQAPADEPVPHRRRAVVLLHRPGGRPPHRSRLPALGRPDLPTTHASPTPRHPAEPDGDHRPARRDHRRASPLAEWAERFDTEGCGGPRRRLRPRWSKILS
jgi:crotonobetainyl-CoA:carnitine CoA-transferase CaiB-like acyl-CoA transferase